MLEKLNNFRICGLFFTRQNNILVIKKLCVFFSIPNRSVKIDLSRMENISMRGHISLFINCTKEKLLIK